MSETLPKKVRDAMNWQLVGLAVFTTGAAMLWGPAAIFMVTGAGIFAAATGEYLELKAKMSPREPLR